MNSGGRERVVMIVNAATLKKPRGSLDPWFGQKVKITGKVNTETPVLCHYTEANLTAHSK